MTKLKYTSIKFFRKDTEWRLFHLALQNQLFKTVLGAISKTNLKIAKFKPKSKLRKLYKKILKIGWRSFIMITVYIFLQKGRGVPRNNYSNILERRGSLQMITVDYMGKGLKNPKKNIT